MTGTAVLVVGGDAIDAGLGPTVVDLARRTRTGVLNSWRAKGLFRFDDPAHLGTIGLQRDDLVLAGVAGAQRTFDRVVVCGVADGELPAGLTGGLPPDAEAVAPEALAALTLEVQEHWTPRPPLYEALAAVCGPAYGADRLPLSPIRAAGDLAGWLPEGAVVSAAAGAPGFWLARTFPTRAPGTVHLPVHAGETVLPAAVRAATSGVVVICGAGDEIPRPAEVLVGDAAARWMVVERWLPDGPSLTARKRLDALAAAAAAGGGVVEVGVATGDLELVEQVAGPAVVWGGPLTDWSR